MKRGTLFDQEVIILDGKLYRVEDFPSDEVLEEKSYKAFKKGFAYRYKTMLQNRIYPYCGLVDDPKEFEEKKPVGIYYVKHGKKYIQRIVFPRTKKEAEEHSASREMSVMSAVSNAYEKNQFIDSVMSAGDSGVESFIPPLHSDDDMLNKIIKFAIRTKDAPFEPYGKRLESLAVEKGKGMEGTNIKNNGKRGLRLNRAMSASKAMQFAETWELDLAIIVKDQPNPMHPISDSGQAFVYYPFGTAFEIDPSKLINAGPLIEQAIIEDKDREEDDNE